MKKIPVITAEMCLRHNPCTGEFEKALKIFPDGLELTKANWDKLIKSDLDWQWLTVLLTDSARTEYEKVKGSAWDEYKKVTDLAWAEYNKVRGSALVEYEKARGSALVEYKKVTDPAWAEYEKVIDSAWAEYEKVKGRALFTALLQTLNER